MVKPREKPLPDCLIYMLSHSIFEALFWPGFSSLVIKRPLRKSPPGRDSRICLLNIFIHDDYTKDWSALIISKSSLTKIRLFIMRKFLLSATSKNNALTVEIRLDNENAWAAHFHGPGLSSLEWLGEVIMVKYLPGSWPCMNMAAFHKDYFYHFSISLSRCCL